MKFGRVVRCTKSYVEDNTEVWTEGEMYPAAKHRDGSWSIKTNEGKVGKVGEAYMLDDFAGHFVEGDASAARFFGAFCGGR